MRIGSVRRLVMTWGAGAALVIGGAAVYGFAGVDGASHRATEGEAGTGGAATEGDVPTERAPTAGREATPAQAATGVDAFKAELERLVGGSWITSNADYQDEDRGQDAYGMEFVMEPGGLAARACLWGERDGEVMGVYWRFFQAWDPVREAGLVYQVSPTGIIGLGYLEERGPGEPNLVQEFRGPTGTASRSGHIETWPGPDVRVSRSFTWADGAWEPQRSYTWRRVRGRETPC